MPIPEVRPLLCSLGWYVYPKATVYGPKAVAGHPLGSCVNYRMLRVLAEPMAVSPVLPPPDRGLGPFPSRWHARRVDAYPRHQSGVPTFSGFPCLASVTQRTGGSMPFLLSLSASSRRFQTHSFQTAPQTFREDQPTAAGLTRRGILGLGAAVAVGVCNSRTANAWEPAPERTLRLYNRLTGESFEGVYWAEGRPVAEALARIDWILRDHRTDACRRIDLALLNRLWEMQETLDSRHPFEVLSAFRSQETNRRVEGAARDSYHLEGRAVDLRLQGWRAVDLYRCALSTGDGGAGCYAKRNFIHVDTGPTRRWVGA